MNRDRQCFSIGSHLVREHRSPLAPKNYRFRLFMFIIEMDKSNPYEIGTLLGEDMFCC